MTTPTIASGTRNESLIALAECCEKETGPDRDLMTQAFALCFPKYYMPGRSGYVGRWTEFSKFLDARAWLDAAMTLVPEGWDWLVRNDVEERGSFANVSRPNKEHIIDTWDEEQRCFYAGNTDGCNYAQAATPALALAAAALKARAAQ